MEESTHEEKLVDISIVHLKNDFMRMDKILEETLNKLKDSEETKNWLIVRSRHLGIENKTLHERLLCAEKGRILAEKESFEFEKKLNRLFPSEDKSTEISVKTLGLDAATSTTSLVTPSEQCEICGNEKVITCAPPDAILLSRSDMINLDTDMSLLKEVLTNKEKIYNDVIENSIVTQAAIENMNQEIFKLRNLNKWKDMALNEKENELQEMGNEIRQLKEKLKRLQE